MHTDWKILNSISQLDGIDALSETTPVVIFKHSTRCGISAGAEYRLRKDWEFAHEQVKFYHLDLIQNRNVSNAIAERYKIVHQSPQLLVVYKGKVVDQTSHHLVGPEFINDSISPSRLA